ncbi:hypothetical protein T4B_10752, partial [Trichinella pseudospiralis]
MLPCQFLITGRSDYIYFVIILLFVGISFYLWYLNIYTSRFVRLYKFCPFIYNGMPFSWCLCL